MEGIALSYLACAQMQQGQLAQANTSFAQAMELLRAVGDRRSEAEGSWMFGLALARQHERARAIPLLRAAVAYEATIGHAKATEHVALVARLEAGAALPLDLLHPPNQRAVGQEEESASDAIAP